MKALLGTSTAIVLALLAAVPTAGAQQIGQVCARSSSGALNCSYQTMAQCQSVNGLNGRQCIENPNLGTTGSGAAVPREGIPPQADGPGQR